VNGLRRRNGARGHHNPGAAIPCVNSQLSQHKDSAYNTLLKLVAFGSAKISASPVGGGCRG
jgi:hypothetical protein